ncbi:GIY-YIG nuclease family protein [Roseofilum sp. BLCC_M154]|uniref:GIY-YIG nuclease family protein n=1 Tax=Roseofilum acuticapitatum BLCC-M154 TaxID=3022444 RepID=A0ABT7AX65_9CYAN|nr:GIY-YIG nuclease family protein [Roseofilum acuticapitatum]MDJ1171511.1 GIY-YIG nuclease family protein [Roseofilum acuticapitatum BLCC-M154]
MSLTEEITNFQIRIRNFLKYVYAIEELSKELGSCHTHEVRERIAELQDLCQGGVFDITQLIEQLHEINRQLGSTPPDSFKSVSSIAKSKNSPLSSRTKTSTRKIVGQNSDSLLFAKDEIKGGIFNETCVNEIEPHLKGIYHIWESPEVQYVGKSDDCIRGRLEKHLKGEGNKRIAKAIRSGAELVFSYWESPHPTYEEALEIARLKKTGFLNNQKRERKPLIIYLDDD